MKMKILVIAIIIIGLSTTTAISHVEELTTGLLYTSDTGAINIDTYDLPTFRRLVYMFDKDIYEQWVEQGDICKEYGHRWEDITPNIAYTTNPITYPPEQRKCSVCEKRQILKSCYPEWIDQQ